MEQEQSTLCVYVTITILAINIIIVSYYYALFVNRYKYNCFV